MHYLAQVSLETLQANVVHAFNPETGNFDIPAWFPQGGDKYIANYIGGQANISGPLLVGNPQKPWVEVQCVDPSIMDQLGATEYGLMRDVLASDPAMRALYKANLIVQGRKLVRNQAGNPVGVTPDFVICGTSPEAGFLAGADPEDLPELLDLED